MGTEPWSAAEVFDENGIITNKTDVFALGCVIYEMLALEAPVSEAESACLIRVTHIHPHNDIICGSFNDPIFITLKLTVLQNVLSTAH